MIAPLNLDDVYICFYLYKWMYSDIFGFQWVISVYLFSVFSGLPTPALSVVYLELLPLEK